MNTTHTACTVDPEVLAHELEMGLNAAHFQTVLNAGLLDVDAFNNGPYTRTAKSRRQFHEGMALLADRALAGLRGDHIRFDRQLRARGQDAVAVDPEVLAHELEMGLDAAHFQTVLNAGLLDVDAFNNGPYTRTGQSRRSFHEGMALLADRSRAGLRGDRIRFDS